MALTPYIWALWQTKTGKVLIICFLLYLILGVIIKAFGWWSILVFALLILFVCSLVYWIKRESEKDFEKKRKDLLEESERLKKLHNARQKKRGRQ